MILSGYQNTSLFAALYGLKVVDDRVNFGVDAFLGIGVEAFH